MDAQGYTSGNSYKNSLFAQLYDFIIERLGRQDLDTEFFRLCSERFGEPILEIGCGTGLKLLPLAEMGFSVVGLDNSPQMLSVFEQKLNNAKPGLKEKVQLILGDMTDPPINRRKFCLIIFGGSQFLHLSTDEQRLSCLNNSRCLLADEGVIVISNSNLSQKSEYNWTEKSEQLNNEWILQAQGKWENGAYQENFKLIPTSQMQQEYLFGWRLYPVKDTHMKNLIERAGLRCVTLPSNLPMPQGRYIYICR